MSELLDAILGFGSGVLNILDMPGSYLRGALGGRLGERLSGRDMLEEWGILDENQEGFDGGDVAGFGADVLLDPLNALGGAGLLRGLSKIGKHNKTSEALRAAGAMPEEVAALTRLADESGPMRFYHGTANPVERFSGLDPSLAGTRTDPGWYGKGVYSSGPRHPDVAAQYAFPPEGPYTKDSKVLMGFVDSRNPFVVDIGKKPVPMEFDDLLPANVSERLQGDLASHVAPMDADDAFGWSSIGPGQEMLKDKVRSESIAKALKEAGHDAVSIILDGHPLEVAAFNGNQLYEPFLAPALRSRREMAPLLAALLGYNTLQAMGDSQ